MSFLYLLEYALVCLLEILANLLPLSVSAWITTRIGRLAFRLMPKRGHVALSNVDHAFGDTLSHAEKREIAVRAFGNAALSILELFIIPKIIKTADKRIPILGIENYAAAMARGKGIILVISHLGSWEYLSFLPYLRPDLVKSTVAVKTFKNPFLNHKINRLRKMMKVTPIPKNNSLKQLLQTLKRNESTAIVIDQWAGPEGIWVDFFGRPTSTTSIPFRLALHTGCALLPAYCLRTGTGRYEIHILKEVPLPPKNENAELQLTLECNRILENEIRKYPEQWMWGHRRWKPKPSTLREV